MRNMPWLALNSLQNQKGGVTEDFPFLLCNANETPFYIMWEILETESSKPCTFN